MKVTAFVSSARKKHTYSITMNYLKQLQSLGNVEYELIPLHEFDLKICMGCKRCIDKGEELCPLKDDRDVLFEKIEASDGIIFASPNYSFGVSGMMKVFLDRFGFLFHRPRYFGKTYTSIVVQGVYGGKKITKYFDFIGKSLGFNVVKGICLNSLEPMTEKEQMKRDAIIEKESRKFYTRLKDHKMKSPGLFDIMVFRMARTSIQLLLNESWRDYTYFKQKGWFESDFYYPVKLNFFEKMVGRFYDFIFNRIYMKKKTEQLFQPS